MVFGREHLLTVLNGKYALLYKYLCKSNGWLFVGSLSNNLPARFLHNLGPIVATNFAKGFIAINNGKVDNLGIGQKE